MPKIKHQPCFRHKSTFKTIFRREIPSLLSRNRDNSGAVIKAIYITPANKKRRNLVRDRVFLIFCEATAPCFLLYGYGSKVSVGSFIPVHEAFHINGSALFKIAYQVVELFVGAV